MILIRPAVIEDIALFEAREADRDELWAGFRHTPAEAIRIGMEAAEAYTVFLHGECAGIFGVVPSAEAHGVAAPWAVFSTAIERYPLPFLRASRRAVAMWRKNFYVLANLVDARNTVVIRWLSWLGFTIHPAKPFGPDARPFCLFGWRHV